VLLSDQDRSSWNQDLIQNGFYYYRLSDPDIHSSNYHIEAAIQAVHIMAPSYSETNWAAILGLYKRLYAMNPNPIIAMHMAVSVGKVHGADAAIDLLIQQPLPDYYLYHAILANALNEAGRNIEAADAFKRAADLTLNSRERKLLEGRFMSLSTIQ
jgi:RNA polymerase sigma-70 factor (ECF subfamily)